MRAPAFVLLAMMPLGACGQDPAPAPAETPDATPTVLGPRTLIAAGFDPLDLGPRFVGPQGDEVTSEIAFDGQVVAQLVSFVACPAPAESDDAPVADAQAEEECRPDTQGEDAVYTYVHRVTPQDGAEGPLLSFRTTRPVHGFANTLGYDRAQAEAALGEGYEIGVQIDNGQLIWRIEAGDGWDAGEEITFFWRSSRPPEGPADAYGADIAQGRAEGSGPWPAAVAQDAPPAPSRR